MYTDRQKAQALDWIKQEAKRLQKKDKNRKPWKSYFNQADAIYASKHDGKSPIGKPSKRKVVKKKSAHRKRKSKKQLWSKSCVTRISGNTTKSKSHVDNNKFRNVDISIGAVKTHIKKAKYGLEKQLSEKMLQQYKATKKTVKKKIGKQIRELKSKINKLS